MSLWDETPSTLTTFAPLSSEVRESGGLLSRLFRKGREEVDQYSDSGSGKNSRDVSVERKIASREQSLDRNVTTKHFDDKSSYDKVSQDLSDDTVSQTEEEEGVKREESPSDGNQSTRSIPKRTLNSVLTRLSNILERRSMTPQVYKDKDFKQYWMPDHSCKECYDCGEKFTTFRRRHHCRICGQIFCNACCNQELPGKIIGFKGSIRVCTYCCTVVQKYAQKADPLSDVNRVKENLQKLESDFSNSVESKSGRHSSLDLTAQARTTGDSESGASRDGSAPFDLTPQSEFVVMDNFSLERKLLVQDSAELRELWCLMMDKIMGVEFQNYRIRLRTYQSCIVGNKLVDWLIHQDKVANRIQAVAIGQALIDADYLEPVGHQDTPFRDDFTLYKPTELSLMEPISAPEPEEARSKSEDSVPKWLQEIETSIEDAGPSKDNHEFIVSTDICEEYFGAKLDSFGRRIGMQDEAIAPKKISVEAGAGADEPFPRQTSVGSGLLEDALNGPLFPSSVPSIEEMTSNKWRTLDRLSEENGEKLAYLRLQRAHQEHLTLLTKQLLSEEGLTPSWEDIIISTVDRISLFVKPDIRNAGDDMDIRNYVHIKKIPGGKKEQTALVHGVMFTKNIAHKKMAQVINNPKILLLKGSIEYQRVENKMSSLQPQILQEEEFLMKSIAKIVSLSTKPEVVVVEKSVSRLAQDYMLQHGITLVYNVKISVMERLARFTQADIVPSIDSLVSGPALGFCHTFCVKTFTLLSGETKTMLLFDGCATHLGCAVTLRGGSFVELKRVKKVMNFMVYASYHSRLEICFSMDEFLMPPPTGDDSSPLETDGKRKVIVEKKKAPEDKNLSQDPKGTKVDVKQATLDAADKEKIVQVESQVFDHAEVRDESHKNKISVSADLSTDDKTRILHQLDDSSQSEEQIIKSEDQNKSDQVIKPFELTVTFYEPDDCTVQSCDNISGAHSQLDSSTLDQSVFSMDKERSIQACLLTDCDISGKETTDCQSQVNSANSLSTTSASQSLISFPVVDEIHSVTETSCGIDVSLTMRKDLISDDGRDTIDKESKTENSNNLDTSEGYMLAEGKQVLQLSELLNSSSCSPDIEVEGITSSKMKDQKNSGDSVLKVVSKEPGKRPGSAVQELTDFSDPLHNYQKNQDDSIFHSSLALKEQQQKGFQRFRKALDSLAVSISPYVKCTLPYLVSQEGSLCEARKYFPEDLYWSKHLESEKLASKNKPKYLDFDQPRKPAYHSNIRILEAHQLILCQLTKPVIDRKVQAVLAEFRAYGGRITVLPNQAAKQPSKQGDLSKSQKSSSGESQSSRSKHPSGENPIAKEGTIAIDNVVVEKKVDCFDLFRHQRLAVLFSSYSYISNNHPNPCVYPWLVTMEFYGKNDITLGGFLERFCFRQSYVCPSDSCDTPMVDHIRRFVHGNGCIAIVLKKLDNVIAIAKTNILMWSWCRKCKQVTPVIPMSIDTWNMSFAKFLELRFHCGIFTRRASGEPCQHSLHHDHYQYFGFKDIVASFKFTLIKLKDIAIPPFVVHRVPEIHNVNFAHIKEETKRLTNKGIDLYSCVLEYVVKLKAEAPLDPINQMCNNHMFRQRVEKKQLKNLSHGIREKLDKLMSLSSGSTFTPGDNILLMEVQDDIVRLKRCLAEAVVSWNIKLQELFTQCKKYMKQITSQKKEKDSAASLGDGEENKIPGISPNKLTDGESTPSSKTGGSRRSTIELDDTLEEIINMDNPAAEKEIEIPYIPNTLEFGSPTEPAELASEEAVANEPFFDDSTVTITMESEVRGDSEDIIKVETENELSTPVDIYTDDFNRPEFMKRKETFEVIKKSDVVEVPKKQEVIDDHQETAIDKMKKTLNTLLVGSSGVLQLQFPFDYCEHHLLPPCYKIPIIVYDHEPSSIIAYTLSCCDYHNKLQEVQSAFPVKEPQQATVSSTTKLSKEGTTDGLVGKDEDTSETAKRNSGASKLLFCRGGSGGGKDTMRLDAVDSVKYNVMAEDQFDSLSDQDGISLFTTSTEVNDKTKSGKQPVNPHIEIQFSDASSRFYCKVYFAEQFRQLRKQLFPAGDGEFIRSLSRCKYWDAKGGNSGSTFCKTVDDRFILKQMSGMEVESFEKFGPQYFQYMIKTYLDEKPTAIAKILGVYRIGFRNSYTNNAMKKDILVVENLFYDKTITKTFDLKGSRRNRLVNTTQKREEELVLLDENFLHEAVDCPLYIRPHSKSLLTMAISQDSQFLSRNLVMDYSLLVGVDEQRRELVVGIIDYIRTFTWDKKLETLLKSTISEKGKMPTVVSPEIYRNRFLDAMDKYFLPVPDQWSGIAQYVEN
ncbi:hypothetical protein ACJMK2_004204 [Sinanodonta woodiana]|uniref:1-phosphatidylinositol-3-phosphate 5-kinase n=1 Tax=Sinanodonta woodiana TaxID=1069815 RepID=A0ABD3Y0I2_SINWO